MTANDTNALTAAQARKIFRYDPGTGRLFWASDRSKKVKSGAEAGTFYKGRNQYRQVCIDYRLYRAHRIIWLMVTGDWPQGEIDHIDGDGLNNRWDNLRDVSRAGNSRNMRRPSNNTSGCVGVCWHKLANKWHVRIYHNQRLINIGLFKSKSDAIRARKIAEIEYGYHANHGRPSR